MKLINKVKKFFKLIVVLAVVVLVSPYLLEKLKFYGLSHAATATANSSSVANAANTQTPATSTPTSAVTPDSLQAISSLRLQAPVSYADAVALAAPAVVSIKTSKAMPIEQNPLFQDPLFRHFFGFGDQSDGDFGYQPENEQQLKNNKDPSRTLQGLGSGVIVSEKGYILTNNHVIRGAKTITLALADGRTAEAKVIGTDPDTDLAVMQITLDKLPVISLGSSHKLRAGDVVLAIGDPFGLDKTVTQGIVSATGRTARTEVGILENLIQTDAAINPGNSGGALIDTFGRLIGINTAIYSRTGGNQGISFAIPIDEATHIMNQLIEGKPIVRGYLGIMMQPLDKEIRDYIQYKEENGVYIRAVVKDSPSQKAGLLPGDVLIKINNIPVKDDREGSRLVAGLTPGKSYPVEIFRKGDYITYTVILGERKQGLNAKPMPEQQP